MNDDQLEGMHARARGASRATNPYTQDAHARRDWFRGYDLMESHIEDILTNARQMVDHLQEAMAQQLAARVES